MPHGHWKTTTFVAALRADGLMAPVVVDGAVNGELFEAYVKQQLVPTLRPGDVVVMDNLAVHQRAGVRTAIEGAGCRLLYLPPYSPDLNPIEPVFGQTKTCRGIDRFQQRGLANCQSEWKVICGTHNLLKLWRSGKACWN